MPSDTDSDAPRGLAYAAGRPVRAGGALRAGCARGRAALAAALAGPAAWPVITRRNPSVLEVFRDARAGAGWNSPSMLARSAARAFWTADALWETGCMTARVWFRTRITWAVTILAVIAWLAWGH